VFQTTYALSGERRFALVDYEEGRTTPGKDRQFIGRIRLNGEEKRIAGRGKGLLSSILDALQNECGIELDIAGYDEHAIGHGKDAQAAAYVECSLPTGERVYGVGIDADVATASVKAILSAANACQELG
jgi:2-isopropylmalate synthase